MAIPPSASPPVGVGSTWLARANPSPASARPTNRELVDAFFRVTSLGWVAQNRSAMPSPKAFTNAKALLDKHQTALRAEGGDSTYFGDMQRETDELIDKVSKGQPVSPGDAATIRSGLATLKNAGYDTTLVTSPRVQALVALDINFARWKTLSDAGPPPPGQRNIDRLIEGPWRFVGSAVAGGARGVVNELVAFRKNEFVKASREYDQAAEARGPWPRKNLPEETSTYARLAAAQARLREADDALQALSFALHEQVHAGKVDWSYTLRQFQPRRPAPPGTPPM